MFTDDDFNHLLPKEDVLSLESLNDINYTKAPNRAERQFNSLVAELDILVNLHQTISQDGIITHRELALLKQFSFNLTKLELPNLKSLTENTNKLVSNYVAVEVKSKSNITKYITNFLSALKKIAVKLYGEIITLFTNIYHTLKKNSKSVLPTVPDKVLTLHALTPGYTTGIMYNNKLFIQDSNYTDDLLLFCEDLEIGHFTRDIYGHIRLSGLPKINPKAIDAEIVRLRKQLMGIAGDIPIRVFNSTLSEWIVYYANNIYPYLECDIKFNYLLGRPVQDLTINISEIQELIKQINKGGNITVSKQAGNILKNTRNTSMELVDDGSYNDIPNELLAKLLPYIANMNKIRNNITVKGGVFLLASLRNNAIKHSRLFDLMLKEV